MTIKLDMAWVAPEIDGSKFPGRTKALVLEFARLCANPDKADDPIDRAVIHAFEEDKGDSAQSVLDARGGVHHRVGFDNTAKRMTVTMESGLVIATHGNTRDAGMAIYPSLADESYTHLTGPQKVAARAQRRASRGSVVSY